MTSYELSLLGRTCKYLNNGITCSDEHCYKCKTYRKHQETIFCIPPGNQDYAIITFLVSVKQHYNK